MLAAILSANVAAHTAAHKTLCETLHILNDFGRVREYCHANGTTGEAVLDRYLTLEQTKRDAAKALRVANHNINTALGYRPCWYCGTFGRCDC